VATFFNLFPFYDKGFERFGVVNVDDQCGIRRPYKSKWLANGARQRQSDNLPNDFESDNHWRILYLPPYLAQGQLPLFIVFHITATETLFIRL
jgi:hypothetical protein